MTTGQLAPLSERIALVDAFVKDNEDTIRGPMSKAEETYIKEHIEWKNKYETKGMKHYKVFTTDCSDYTQFLPKITQQRSASSSLKTQDTYFHLLNNRKLISLGGDPLLPENEGGLSLAFIFKHIHNSGLYTNRPLFFHCNDNGRVISNIFRRVWRIVNNYK